MKIVYKCLYSYRKVEIITLFLLPTCKIITVWYKSSRLGVITRLFP